MGTIENTDEIRWRYGQPLTYNVFAEMPKKLVTEEFCLAAVQKSGCLLFFIPGKLKTQAVCIAAVKQYAKALQSVPKKLQSKVKAALEDG